MEIRLQKCSLHKPGDIFSADMEDSSNHSPEGLTWDGFIDSEDFICGLKDEVWQKLYLWYGASY